MQNLSTPTRKSPGAPRPTDAQRCRANSKQSKKRCGNYAAVGKTLCKFHGASREGVPNKEGTTHGGASAFIRKEQLPEIVARMRDLDTKEGKAEFVKLRTALTEQIADNLKPLEAKPEQFGDVAIELALKVEDRLAKNVALLHEMEAEQAAPGNTTYVVANFDPAKQAPFLARGLDGTIKVRLLDGQPFMLDEATGGWMPALEHTDEESQAKYFTRLLLEAAPK